MDYFTFLQALQRGQLARLYLFCGSENFLLEDALLRLVDEVVEPNLRDFNYQVIDGQTADDGTISSAVETLPFMGEKRIVVVRDTPHFKGTRKKEEREDGEEGEVRVVPRDQELIRLLERIPETTCLVFTTSEGIDKRKALTQAVVKNGQIVEFNPLKGSEALTWVSVQAKRQNVPLNPQAIQTLVERIGSNAGELHQALQKLALCCHGKQVLDREDVLLHVAATAESSIFTLVDAIGRKDIQLSLRTLHHLLEQNEPPLKILFMIVRQLRLIYQVKCYSEQGYSLARIGNELKLAFFMAQKYLQQARNFSRRELQLALEAALATDTSIKTGKQEAVLGIELLIVRLCKTV